MSDEVYGHQTFSDRNGHYNATRAVVDQVLSRKHTGTVVRIVAVRGGVGPVGSVDVEPLVNQIDGKGVGTEHGIIYGLPYLRAQGGTSAIIMDPKVGDVGVALFANRDISNVKTSKAKALPASRRMFSMSDGIYMGGTLNGTPTQYVSFLNDQIQIVSTTKITLSAPEVDLNSDNVKISGTALTHNGHNINGTHVHPEHDGGTTTGPQ